MQLHVNDVLDFVLKLAESMKISVPDHSEISIDYRHIPDACVNWCQPIRIHWEVDPKTVNLQQKIPELEIGWQQVGLKVGLSRDFTTDSINGMLHKRPLPGVDFVISFTPLPTGWNPQCVPVERDTL